MRLFKIISFISLSSALVIGGVGPASAHAGENRKAADSEHQWMSIPQVHQKLEAAGYRNVEKIERERGGYEARATDHGGARIKLYVNPQSGEIVDRRGHAKRAEANGNSRQSYSADCSKRRCRDDLPQNATLPMSAVK